MFKRASILMMMLCALAACSPTPTEDAAPELTGGHLQPNHSLATDD